MRVIALCGLPGAGKSTLAAALARSTDFVVLDRDMLRTEFPHAGYAPADKRLLNELVRARMLANLLARRDVVLDGMTLARESDRARFAETARRAGADWLLVWLDCDPETARSRLARDPSHPAVDREPALVDAVLARFEPPADALRIHAGRPVSEQLRAVLAALPP